MTDPPNSTSLPPTYELTNLIYELLDAHMDTAQLAERLSEDSEWAVHLSYLRDLQRLGREALAQID